jgi:hypothetical protein
MGQRREAKRLAQAWKDEEEIREDKMRTTSSSSRHTICGQCDGADKILQASLHRTVTALHRTVKESAAKGPGGEEVLRVVTRARSALDDAANKKEVSDENWTGLKQVIASELPSWDSGIPGSVQKGVEKLLVKHMLDLQGTAAKLIQSAIVYSKEQCEFLRKREKARGWMQLVIRTWREEVELRQPDVANAADKWKVRRNGDKDDDYRNKRISRATKKEKEEAARICVRAGTRATPSSTEPELLTETPAEKLRLLMLATLNYARVYRPSNKVQVTAPQRQPGREKWERLRARLAQVVDSLRAQQETAQAGGRQKRDGIPIIDYNQSRTYKARGQGDTSAWTTIRRKEKTTIAARNGMFLQNWMQECGEGNKHLQRRVGIG